MAHSPLTKILGALFGLAAASSFALAEAGVWMFARLQEVDPMLFLGLHAVPFALGLFLLLSPAQRRQRRRISLDRAAHQADVLKPHAASRDAARASARAAATSAPSQRPDIKPRGPGWNAAEPSASSDSGRDLLLVQREEIETKMNRAKVQYGLGQLSARAYTNYLKGLEEEKANVEEKLLHLDLEDAPEDGQADEATEYASSG